MKKLRNILRGFAGNNRGAGIVVVLVSMVCVALMGASILFMSYTAIRLKATERQASKDFYSAETAVDEIRAGVQSVVSESIATAYKYALEHYSSGVDVTDEFQDEFVKVLKKKDILFYTEDNKTKYKVLTLQDYVSNDDYVDVGGTGTVEVDETKNTFLLKDIQVTYTANGYETTISTDIFINAPKFDYVSSSTRTSGLPQHALIARKELIQADGQQSQIQILGSAYAGKITLDTPGSKMTISDGTLVCAGDVVVRGATANGRLVTHPDEDGVPFKLWASRIVVDSGSSVNLDGETRVLDDLDLAGSGAEAVLSGSYYGFGDGTSDDGRSTGNADRSSAILVNGANSTLNISGLNRLMLAGRAYISNILYPNTASLSGFEADNLETLESVSVRSNQQMYLIDPKYLSGTSQNPLISGDEIPQVSLNTEGEALRTEHGFKLKPLHLPVAGADQKAHYYLMDFNDNVSASAYFEDYFRTNSAQINSYLGAGSNLNSLTINAPGYAIGGSNGNYYVTQADDADFGWDSLRATFELLTTTLIDPTPDSRIYNEKDPLYPYDPYEYIVNINRVDAVNGVRNFMLDIDGDGNREIVAIVTDNENFTLPSGEDYDDLLIVLSSGNVTVNRSFEGLVISGGTIDIQGGVTLKAYPRPVAAAFSATNGTETFRDYLLCGADTIMGEDMEISTNGWKLDSLVTYKNWIKN
jgi:hypothetical protein